MVETPLVIAVICRMIFMLLQPAVMLIGKMMVGYTVGCVARVAATDISYGGENHAALLKAYAADKLSALPQTDLFYVPDSLQVSVGGTPKSDFFKVTVSIKQKPLPLVGATLKKDSAGLLVVSSSTKIWGAQLQVDPTYGDGPLIVGVRR